MTAVRLGNEVYIARGHGITLADMARGLAFNDDGAVTTFLIGHLRRARSTGWVECVVEAPSGVRSTVLVEGERVSGVVRVR